jgi:hypothetical protein
VKFLAVFETGGLPGKFIMFWDKLIKIIKMFSFFQWRDSLG